MPSKKNIDNAEQSKKRVILPTTLLPLRVPNKKQENHVVLPHWQREEQTHYAWVKNLNRLLSRSKSHRGQTYFTAFKDLSVQVYSLNTLKPVNTSLFKPQPWWIRKLNSHTGLRRKKHFSGCMVILSAFWKIARRRTLLTERLWKRKSTFPVVLLGSWCLIILR